MKKRTILFILFVLTTFSLKSQEKAKVQISLFNDFLIETMVFTPLEGKFELQFSDKYYKLRRSSILYITNVDGKISIREINRPLGYYDTVKIVSRGEVSISKIKPVHPNMESREYNGGYILTPANGGIRIINDVGFDQYLAGVVEAEAGPSATLEFYKAQALLCRTYALKYMGRHGEEGFQLCDATHCQAYKGRNMRNPKIIRAVIETRGKVLANEENKLIIAAFHSNSGGYTANSEDVWIGKKDYLRAVKDTYSLAGRNAKWTKKITLNKWKKYLIGNGYKNLPQNLSFYQKARKQHYIAGHIKISLAKIRQDLGLKSSFFDVTMRNNYIIFSGKGYGHGVGLSQEGAMNMARQGKTYQEIINFYFKGIKIIDSQHIVHEKAPEL